jgi:ribonuclease R
MVCEMTISDSGRVTGYEFYEGVMHSHARLTYTKVSAILTGEDEQAQAWREEYAAVKPQLESLYKLFQCLRQARDERGAIDFETVETRIQFNEQRKIERIVPVKRNDAHRLIEECMLCANVCAAKFLEKHNLAGLYRVHEGPTEQKLTNLRAYLSELGLGLAGGDRPTSGDYQRLMQVIQGRTDAHLIQTVMLRSMRQAMYQVENHGHFGLGYEAYTHFTSPIRRYPDLLVHRAIRSVIRSEQVTAHVRRAEGAKPLPLRKIYPYSINEILVFGEQCSRTERRADEATRDVVSWLKCEYLRDQVGAVYDGHVSSVTSFGLFVELNDLYVEGLVHITSLPLDYYRHDAAQHRLVGERTRRVYGLGDEVVVRVVGVDLDNRKIDFEIESSTAIRRPSSAVKPKAIKKTGAKKSGAQKTGAKKTDMKKPDTKNTGAKKTGTKKTDALKMLAPKSGTDKADKQKSHTQKSNTKKAGKPKAAPPKAVAKKTDDVKKIEGANNTAKTKSTTKAPAVKKVPKKTTPAKAPATSKTGSTVKEAGHAGKTQKTASKTAATKVQPEKTKTTAGKAIAPASKADAQRGMAKPKKKS